MTDFSPDRSDAEPKVFRQFVKDRLKSVLDTGYRTKILPAEFFRVMGNGGWYGFHWQEGAIRRHSSRREAMVADQLARECPGAAIAALAHMDLGFMALYLFGTPALQKTYGPPALAGETIMCLGNTENIAGSDVAGIGLQARPVKGGWRLSGAKAYVTNGAQAHLAVITAVSHPEAPRNRRLSMFLVDLSADGVKRRKLNKQVWIPSDLTRLQFDDVFVAEDHLLGRTGKGLQQVLDVFTHSRVPISALTLGTAQGAFDRAVKHARKRQLFGRRLDRFQAKSFEMADLYARLQAARLMLDRACEQRDSGNDFRLQASMTKYLAVDIARQVTGWAADLFGAASVIYEHPIHRFPMDTWGAALGEGTQDVQKLVIFREMIKLYDNDAAA